MCVCSEEDGRKRVRQERKRGNGGEKNTKIFGKKKEEINKKKFFKKLKNGSNKTRGRDLNIEKIDIFRRKLTL